MTTKARLTSRGSRTACTPPFTRAAATRPPTIEAAALSAWPSIRAATARGSSAPAAAAAATARAADEPRPRAIGICERTVMASRSVPATSMATRAARCDGSSDRPAPSPSDRTMSFEDGLHLDLDVPVEGDGQGVEAGAEVGRRRWGSCAHTDTVLVVDCDGRDRSGRRAVEDGQPWTSRHHQDGSGKVPPSSSGTDSSLGAQREPGRTDVAPGAAPGGTTSSLAGHHPLPRPPQQPRPLGVSQLHPMPCVRPRSRRRWPPVDGEWPPTTGTIAASEASSSFSTTGPV